MPPKFAHQILETWQFDLGTHLVEPEIDARGVRSLVEPVSWNSAPIGAQVFAIERRNHSKTGVYENFCVRVPVDTTIAVDKMKKAEKGFKFERFDVFTQLIGSSRGPQGSIDRKDREDRIEREAAESDGLSFDSTFDSTRPKRPNRSLRSRLQTRQIAAAPDSSQSGRFPATAIRSPLRSMEPPGISGFFSHSPVEPQTWIPQVFRVPQSCGRMTSNSPGPESKASGVLSERDDSAQSQYAERADFLIRRVLGHIECGTPLAVWTGCEL